MPTVTKRAIIWNTTAGNKTTAAFTPAANDLLIAVVGLSGTDSAPTMSDSQGGAWTLVAGFASHSTSVAGGVRVYARNSGVSASSMTVTMTSPGGDTGGGLAVFSVAGANGYGSGVIRSQGTQADQASGGTPAPVLSLTPLSANAILAGVMDNTNGTANAVPRSGYTEQYDQGYNTPATGIEVNSLDSGETSATITFGGTTPSQFASWAIEVSAATDRRAQVSWSELETPDAPRRTQVSWSELETPDAPRRGQVSWSELETPDAPRRAQVSWSEFETPNEPRRAQVSWSEFEVPDVGGTNRRAQVSWSELQVPDAPRRVQVSWSELETPDAPRRAQVSFSEIEVPDEPRRAQASWSELQVPDAPRRAQVSWSELETPSEPRRAQVSWSELEAPSEPRRGQVSWSELEIPSAPRRAQLSWSELQTPNAPLKCISAEASLFEMSASFDYGGLRLAALPHTVGLPNIEAEET